MYILALRLTEGTVQRFRRYDVWRKTVERGAKLLGISDERVILNIMLFLIAFFGNKPGINKRFAFSSFGIEPPNSWG